MTSLLASAFAVAAGYLLGGIPNAYLLARLKGVDIRTVGSGNVGATNVFRIVSKPLGLLTFVLDAVKGWVPAALFPAWAATLVGAPVPDVLGIFCGLAAIAGHSWSPYLGLKGGKGVATSAGMLLGIAPAAGGIALGAWLLIFGISRYVSLASVCAAVIVPVAGWMLYGGQGLALPVTLTVIGGLVVWRHRTNIRRLATGSEHRFHFTKKQALRGGDEEPSGGT